MTEPRHDQVFRRLYGRLSGYAREHGGRCTYAALEGDPGSGLPSLIYIRPEHAGRVERSLVRGAPDLVVEVSAPPDKTVDAGRKRSLYEKQGVGEYWLVDLGTDRIEVHRRAEGGFEPAATAGREGSLETPLLPGLSLSVDEILGPPEG